MKKHTHTSVCEPLKQNQAKCDNLEFAYEKCTHFLIILSVLLSRQLQFVQSVIDYPWALIGGGGNKTSPHHHQGLKSSSLRCLK
jgi:hypothetical protein